MVAIQQQRANPARAKISPRHIQEGPQLKGHSYHPVAACRTDILSLGRQLVAGCVKEAVQSHNVADLGQQRVVEFKRPARARVTSRGGWCKAHEQRKGG